MWLPRIEVACAVAGQNQSATTKAANLVALKEKLQGIQTTACLLRDTTAAAGGAPQYALAAGASLYFHGAFDALEAIAATPVASQP